VGRHRPRYRDVVCGSGASGHHCRDRAIERLHRCRWRERNRQGEDRGNERNAHRESVLLLHSVGADGRFARREGRRAVADDGEDEVSTRRHEHVQSVDVKQGMKLVDIALYTEFVKID